jgi:hypothetical protein
MQCDSEAGIHRCILETAPAPRRAAIDFGCGGGVFLPVLANTCDLVQGTISPL